MKEHIQKSFWEKAEIRTNRGDFVNSGEGSTVESLRCRRRLRGRRCRSRSSSSRRGTRTSPPFCPFEHLARQDEHPSCLDPEQAPSLELAWAA